jgi:hypothetical protein
MSKLDGKTCPVFKSACLMGNCAMYDSRLDNCVVHVGSYNMYLVAMGLKNLDQVSGPQNKRKTPGFPGMN